VITRPIVVAPIVIVLTVSAVAVMVGPIVSISISALGMIGRTASALVGLSHSWSC
jgi:hypothetical protein